MNIDSSIIDKGISNEEESLEKQLGKNVELVNFDYNDDSGLTSESFNFDGKNDYIKIKYDTEEQKGQLANRGFTFEFYGIWDGGTTDPKTTAGYKGLFCYWNGNESEQAIFRFGINGNNNYLIWNSSISGNNKISDYSGNASAWNIVYPLELSKLKTGAYITITMDATTPYKVTGENYKGDDNISEQIKDGEYYKQRVYMDGKILYEGDYNKWQWDTFKSSYLQELKYFCIGRSSMTEDGTWNYSKMRAKSLRLYSRALSEKEVQENYETSTKYHSSL